MIIVCPSCQARYKFDESKLAARPRNGGCISVLMVKMWVLRLAADCMRFRPRLSNPISRRQQR